MTTMLTMLKFLLDKIFGNEPQYPLYPDITLPPTVHHLLNFIDHHLVTSAPSTPGEYMELNYAVIPLNIQHLSVSRLCELLTRQIGTAFTGMYIPRSVAFFTEANGDWVFVYSVRGSVGTHDLGCKMFIELLTRTNNAR